MAGSVDSDTTAYIARLERQIEIEEALERVRERTMAMDASEELAEMAAVMFENLLGLYNIDPLFARCMIVLTDEVAGVHRVWSTDSAGRSLADFRLIPLTEHPVQRRIYEAWKKDKAGFVSTKFSQEQAREYSQYLARFQGFNSDMELARVIEGIANNSNQIPDHFYLNFAFFSYGRVGMITVEELDAEQVEILKRFARVFEQTYTRFLDLQKAEALAFETMQQTSLDRVRGEIASMRTAEDLQRVTPLIWRELTMLGVPFFRCGVFIINDDTRLIQSFVTTPTGEHLATLEIPFEFNKITRDAVDAWRHSKVYTNQWDREQFSIWTRDMLEHGHMDGTQELLDIGISPELLYLHFVPFSQGMLYVGSDVALSEEQIKMMLTLADAFSVAYARYEDFQALEAKNEELATTLSHLEETQAQLIHSEKMASLGHLIAGIAHEIKNPLNFVNNFARLNSNLIDELQGHLAASGDDVQEILRMLKLNESKIDEHGNRADRIVKSMMQHARGTSGEMELTLLNAFVDEYVSLAIHGLHLQYPNLIVDVVCDYDDDIEHVKLMPQEIGRVLVNILNNAVDAMREKKDAEGEGYQPRLHLSTGKKRRMVFVKISDNGAGISPEIRERIFEPFFTTKSSGYGTGLGLSLSYDIITQGHGGKLEAESTPGEGATLIIQLPAR